ncbi:oxygen-insensitive NADPH nitroreductase [Evansella cellulosilytica]|uniref:Nitroreductase n=1 Tax=Evansella cellulosilytica (strain ATCC 21833 / DSM 2522 / FERM P-1141 / JCM 9156 / N-4) TaxID=649639 RepID=E6TVC7_EVAC2|nr:oxygen-insensitive NADPH nitroreductase [Evansella cellulosilytica]ADU30944.1 nitroreductase [Evansella cellulosilytica DSM 2522]
MNDVIETILNHRSIRSFVDEPLCSEQIKTIVRAAQMASTSSYIQAYTIIGVKNKTTKATLAELAGNQPYVEKNGHFFLFCADLHRHEVSGKIENVNVSKSLESTEKLLVSIVDASLAAQNATLAAESMGLGICYIGGIRNNIDKVAELLKLPSYVIPLFGLAVGVPEKDTEQKPRLPFDNIYHEEEYLQDETTYINHLDEYNKTVSAYYERRTKGKRSDRWTEQMADMLKEAKRTHMKTFLQNKGFMRD